VNWRREKWLKLYVREEGSFARLPLVVRAIAGQLLKYVDELGMIDTGGRDAADVIAFRAGATVSDRRALRMAIPMLLQDGFLVASEQGVRVRNYPKAQGRESVTTGERDKHEPGTTEARPTHESTANTARPTREIGTSDTRPEDEKPDKPPESLQTGRVVEIRKEERREEERRGEEPPPPNLWDAGRWLFKFGVRWCEQYGKASYGSGTSDAKACADLGDILTSLTTAERLEAQERADEMLREYLADRTHFFTKRRHPFELFVKDFNGLRVGGATADASPDARRQQQRDAELLEMARLSNAKEAARGTGR
jgi:hypothetical protein